MGISLLATNEAPPTVIRITCRVANHCTLRDVDAHWVSTALRIAPRWTVRHQNRRRGQNCRGVDGGGDQSSTRSNQSQVQGISCILPYRTEIQRAGQIRTRSNGQDAPSVRGHKESASAATTNYMLPTAIKADGYSDLKNKPPPASEN